MIRLSRPREPRTVALGFGVTVTLKPLSFAVYRAAIHSAERRAREMAAEIGLIEAAGGSILDIPDPHDRDGMRGLRDQFLLQALARHAITGWQGVGDDAGDPAPLTPEAADTLICGHPLIAERFELEYLRDITELVAEGNGSGAAPEWHFGGGAGYCGNCRASGAPCADGRPGGDGRFCLYDEHAPVSLEGAVAWTLLTEGAGQWRRAGMDGAIIGLNLAGCLARPSAAEPEGEALEYLLLAGEAGALAAMQRAEGEH